MNSHQFKLGLYRVAKPIEGNPNYHEILGGRVDAFLEKYSFNEVAEPVSAEVALEILVNVLQTKYLYEFFVPPKVALAFGKTRNNLREFKFLQQFLIRHGFDGRILNSGVIPPRLTSISAVANAAVIDCVSRDFFDYCRKAQGVSKPLLYQLINYVQGYLSWRHTFERDEQYLPRVLVLANDHSPGQVASSMAARERGISRIYVQHAEVSGAFPPLDFELSILRNAASRKIYESNGVNDAEVFAVTRESSPFLLPCLPASNRGVDVGVYTTSQVNWEGVRQLLERLSTNPEVSRVFLKPHPSTRLSRVQSECPGVSAVYETPTEPHIAVVANSSVVIELLHHGIPVVQFYGMDSVPDDYYGFSRKGIAPRIELDEFSGRFWNRTNFNEEWLQLYAQYDAAATPAGKQEELRLAQALSKWFPSLAETGSLIDNELRSCLREPVKERDLTSVRAKFGSIALMFYPVTSFDYFGRGSRLGKEGTATIDRGLTLGLDRLFAHRSAAAFRAFDFSSRVHVGDSSFIHSAKRRDIELSGRNVTEGELREIIEFALRRGQLPEDQRRNEYNVFFFLLRLDRVEEVARFLSRATYIRYDDMHINSRIGLMRWASACPARAAAAALDPTVLFRGLSAFHRLKLEVLAASEDLFVSKGWDHQAIEQLFTASAPAALALSYQELVSPIYTRLRARMKYMDVRWAAKQREAVIERIERAIARQEAFSMIRLGDGEGYVFGGRGRLFNGLDAMNRERHWWGEVLPDELRRVLIASIRESIGQADVLGIPSIYRFLRDNSDRSGDLKTTPNSRGLIEVLAGVDGLILPHQELTEDRANLSLFSDLSLLRRLFPLARNLIVIASAEEAAVRAVFNDVECLHYLPVPTHNRTARNDKYRNGGRPLPFVYEGIRESIAEIVGPGDLVLVAAGIVGKIFIGDARQAGAVALDVGSSLDEWVEAGIHSLH